MSGVEAKALADTLADPVAKVKAGTHCITLAHIKPEVLLTRWYKMGVTHLATLVDFEAKALVDSGADTLLGADTRHLGRKCYMCRPRHWSTWCLTR